MVSLVSRAGDDAAATIGEGDRMRGAE